MGDPGQSYTSRRDVFDEIFSRLPNALILAALGVIIAVLFVIPVGILSATRKYSMYATAECTDREIGLTEVSTGHFVACHLV